MLLDVSHLNLTFEFIRGIKNATADFRSRKPRDSWEAFLEEDGPIKLRLGIRTVKAQKLQIELGRTEAKYQQMLHHTEQETEDKYIEDESLGDLCMQEWQQTVG